MGDSAYATCSTTTPGSDLHVTYCPPRAMNDMSQCKTIDFASSLGKCYKMDNLYFQVETQEELKIFIINATEQNNNTRIVCISNRALSVSDMSMRCSSSHATLFVYPLARKYFVMTIRVLSII